MSDYSINMEREEFSKLLNILKTFENSCTDCDIQDGFFRTKSNDRTSIIEIDLSSILSHHHLTMTLIKVKMNLLKSFELDDNIEVQTPGITIESNESNYEFYDEFSKLIFRKPLPRFLDNQFITDANMAQIINLRDDNLIFSHTINNYIKKRIKSICLGLQCDTIDCQLNELSGSLKILSKGKENESDIVKDIVLNMPFENKCFKLIAMPFLLDIVSNMNFSCYKHDNTKFICVFKQSYFGIPITIYSHGKME